MDSEIIITAIVTATIAISALIKRFVESFAWDIHNEDARPVVMNIATGVVAIGLSCIANIFLEQSWRDVIIYGAISFLLAIGGYESIVNLLRGIVGKKIL